MKKIKVIANTSSGRESALSKVQQLIALTAMEEEFELNLLFTHKKGDGTAHAENYSGEDIIVCVGGDGTLNEVVNGIYRSKRDTPLAILPCGTVNDFATYLELPQDPRSFYKMLKRDHRIKVDLGVADDRAFINVAAGGFLSNVAYTVSDDSKAILGRFAYYIAGIREVISSTNNHLMNLEVKSKEYNGSIEAMMFIIANSTSVGGFKQFAPHAEIHDGLLDVIILKSLELNEAVDILVRFYNGNHVDHEKVVYLKTSEITLSADSKVIVDLDGEEGDQLPTTFKVLNNELTLLI